MVTRTRCGASSLPEAFLTSLLEKLNCARRFEEFLTSEKLGGRSDVSSTSRRARTKGWLRAQDAAHRACEKTFQRRTSKKLNCAFYFTCHETTFWGGSGPPPQPPRAEGFIVSAAEAEARMGGRRALGRLCPISLRLICLACPRKTP